VPVKRKATKAADPNTQKFLKELRYEVSAVVPFEAEVKPTENEKLVDEYGELVRELALFRPKADRAAHLGRVIASWFEQAPAERSFIADGVMYEVQVSAKQNQRNVIDIAELYARCGKNLFLQIANPKLGNVEKYAPELLVEERTGPRRTVPVLKLKQAA
jgi:hypothetical protein